MEQREVVVSFANGIVTVDKPILSIDYGTTAQITWKPEAGASWVLKMIVFTRPIGNGTPVAVPQEGPQGTIVTTDVNDNTSGVKDRFKYLVFVESGGRVFPSEDPEIVNDPQGGVMDGDDDDQGGG